MFKYRKPKNLKELIDLIRMAGKQVPWFNRNIVSESDEYFENHKPMVLIYTSVDELKYIAFNKSNKPMVYDLLNRDVTVKINKKTLNEIYNKINQTEFEFATYD